MNVVITGASSGIGKALATTFARNGHAVLVVARKEERLLSLCQELILKYGVTVNCLALDITAPGATKTLFGEAVQVFEKVQVLINNAGMSPYQEFPRIKLQPYLPDPGPKCPCSDRVVLPVHAPYAEPRRAQPRGER